MCNVSTPNIESGLNFDQSDTRIKPTSEIRSFNLAFKLFEVGSVSVEGQRLITWNWQVNQFLSVRKVRSTRNMVRVSRISLCQWMCVWFRKHSPHRGICVHRRGRIGCRRLFLSKAFDHFYVFQVMITMSSGYHIFWVFYSIFVKHMSFIGWCLLKFNEERLKWLRRTRTRARVITKTSLKGIARLAGSRQWITAYSPCFYFSGCSQNERS